MKLHIVPFKKTLNKAYQKVKPNRSDIERFKGNLARLLDRIDHEESEENVKNHLRDFLNDNWYKNLHLVNTKGRTDLVIHEDRSPQSRAAVLFEVKRPKNSVEMISAANANARAMHEMMLYYLRERIEANNTDIKYLVITNVFEWYIFEGATFDRLFYQNKKLVKDYLKWRSGQKVQNTTDFFYRDIARPFLEQLQAEVSAAHFNIRDFAPLLPLTPEGEPKQGSYEVGADMVPLQGAGADDKKLIPLFKIFSPQHLLKQSFANDSNSLDKRFYNELLYLIGLEEKKEGGKKLIHRCDPASRQPGSLLENTIATLETTERWRQAPKLSNYGVTKEEQLFGIALELCITWMNRILFLKLLEAQLVKYHSNKERCFLKTATLKDFDEMNELFFEVLAKTQDERADYVRQKFRNIPYLNSSLFEINELEAGTLFISNLKDRFRIKPMSSTVLKDEKGKRRSAELSILEYLFAFLDAYDFASEGSEEIQEENKTLINASVLGLIFEKINGYRDGSFFTPGFITMYMCRETVRSAVVQKFNESYGFRCNDLGDLANHLATKRNKTDILEHNCIVNSLRICDPAVGSGHFLVSALNEIMAVKSELGLLADREGVTLRGYEARVENDELIVTCNEGQDLFEYHLRNGTAERDMQRVQETLFHEKQTVIESCLFGVDINPNSVKICRLRLWIELLKNTYYKGGTEIGGLETLPNIDINIKTGNSLISRFALNADLGKALKSVKYDIGTYRRYVQEYHHATDKETKRGLLLLIEQIKSDFKTEIGRDDPKRKRLDKLLNEMYHRFTGNFLFEPDTPYGESEDDLERKRVQEKEKLEKEIKKLTFEIEEIKNNRIYENAFEWRFEFPEVLDAEGRFVGFDVVIGNPPYIRIQDLRQNESLVEWYNSNFLSTGSGNYDLYIPFIELGYRLLSKRGEHCFIMPHKFTNANYGEKIREFIVQEKSLRKVLHFGALQVFEDATTYTGLFFFNKNNNDTIEFFGCEDFDYLGNRNISFQSIPAEILTKDEWVFLSNKEAALQLRLTKEFPTLEALTERIFQGLKTSADKIYILEKLSGTDDFYEVFCRENEKKYHLERSILYPLIKGGNSRAYQILDTDLLILFPYKNGEIINAEELSTECPKTWAYLNEHKHFLENRENGKMKGDKWYGYVYPKALKLISQPKIFTPDIAPTPRISYDEAGDFMFTGGVSGGYGIVPRAGVSSLYLLAVLNNQVAFWYIRKTSTQMRGGWFSFESRYIKNIPIPHPVENLEKIESLVTQILAQKQFAPQSDTTTLEREIDALVYGLYGLTAEEVEIVRGG